MSQALSARRCFRLGAVTALALVVGYASPMPLPYFAPLFAWLLAATPAPPIGPRFLVGLVVVAVVGLSVGRLLAPMLMQFPVTAFLLAALGLYFSFYITLNLGKAVLGVFLTMGLMLISVTGILSLPLADAMIDSLAWGLVIAVLAQWLVYPWFPESDPFPPPVAPPGAAQSNWVALRGTLITLPVFWVALAYPATYIPVMMKAVT
ncbi:MAG TPA: DUF2955 domain-containing protein, partial [Thiotrichales bacterium]|nr:DUF2955 domain-containing protein [Thiotrichales bacterium]